MLRQKQKYTHTPVQHLKGNIGFLVGAAILKDFKGKMKHADRATVGRFSG